MPINLNIKNILGALWILIILAAIYYYLSHGISIETIQSNLAGLGWWSGLVFILAYTIRPLVFFPASIMTPLSAVLFGPVMGWVYTYIGENLSATVAFFTARYFGRNFVKENQNAFIKKYDEKLRCCGFETVLTLRLIPLFPFDFVNYASGLSAIRYSSYIGATLLGVIPGLTAYIFLGGSLMNPYLIIPTVILFGLIAWFVHRHHKKTKDQA
ncbi:MAG: TVP38/TMEM64 family protein [Candidatus Nomurabacteria bacterium]|nr:TVP38/TMEM64 family protein [Candidatus Nomurabacteria bacterium]USN87293.1 MAG: TVP38/TMEM64 family protein [Candidatus Nomurabacteria bacterium]